MIDKKLEKMYEQVNHLENPLTPNQVLLLKKVISKFKSKVFHHHQSASGKLELQLQVRTGADSGSGGEKSPMLSEASRATSPRPPTCGPNTLAVPSPSPGSQRNSKAVRKAAWGKFIRKTSEQMLGIPGLNKVNKLLWHISFNRTI